MNSDSSMAEWFLMLPLWPLCSVTGGSNVVGPAVLVAFLTLVGLWVAIFSRWKLDGRPPKLVGLFLVAVVGFFPVVLLVMVQDSVPQGPRENQFLAVVQSYFSLSVLYSARLRMA